MISVSFLGIKENLKENLKKLDQTGIEYLHFDIMDGKFVEEKTWSSEELTPLVTDLKTPFDVHFMVEDINQYITDFKSLKPEYMTFHIEATKKIEEQIEEIKKTGSKVGISLKPNTPIETIKPYLKEIDLVLVMSVEPGKGGQPFLEGALERIKELNELRTKHNLHYIIEVDGGINPYTKKECEKVGADLFVVGSYITNKEDYKKQIEQLK